MIQVRRHRGAVKGIGSFIVSYLYKIGRTLTIPIEPMIEEKRAACGRALRATRAPVQDLAQGVVQFLA